jgi:hypothetical protein
MAVLNRIEVFNQIKIKVVGLVGVYKIRVIRVN